MKSTFLLMSLLVTAVVSRAQYPAFSTIYNPGGYLTVHATAGLSLREKPDVSSKVIEVIKLGEKVQVMDDPNEKVPYSSTGVPGHWVKVNYYGKIGYQFDGFLSRFPVFTGQNTMEPGGDIATYLKTLYQVKKEIAMPQGEHSNARIWHEIWFTNGIHFLEKSEGSYDIEIDFPSKWFSYHEAFLLGREVWPFEFAEGNCPYNDQRILCEMAKPQYLSIQRMSADTTNFSWYVSD